MYFNIRQTEIGVSRNLKLRGTKWMLAIKILYKCLSDILVLGSVPQRTYSSQRPFSVYSSLMTRLVNCTTCLGSFLQNHHIKQVLFYQTRRCEFELLFLKINPDTRSLLRSHNQPKTRSIQFLTSIITSSRLISLSNS